MVEYEASGLFYEEFEEGRSWRTAARTVGESDVSAFSALTGDYTYLHTDARGAAQTPFGERVAHGLLGLSFLIGLVTRLGVIEGTVEAFLGLEWRFRGPIRFGDTIHGEVAVKSRRVSSKGQGLVTLALRLLNQRDETIHEGDVTIMVARREKGGG